MLQQTQVRTVLPYYRRFIADFPTPRDLAEAPEEAVLKDWEGLGYYSRARHLQEGVREVCEKYDGRLPDDKKALLSIKGIGPYTAGALLSIAYGRPEPAIDGNVMRVMARIFLIDADIAKTKTKKMFESIVAGLIEDADPSAFNQSLMDLGALICRPKQPLCDECPLCRWCGARREGVQSDYPIKSRKIPPKRMDYAVLLLCRSDGRVLIERRPSAGLLAGLWQFPMIPCAPDNRPDQETVTGKYGAMTRPERQPFSYIHHFSHLTWNLSLYTAYAVHPHPAAPKCKWTMPEDFELYPFPVPDQKIIEWVKKNMPLHIKTTKVGNSKDRGGDMQMAKKNNANNAGTDVEQVKKQNAQSQQEGQYGTEFGSETNAQEVRRQNQQSQQNKH